MRDESEVEKEFSRLHMLKYWWNQGNHEVCFKTYLKIPAKFWRKQNEYFFTGMSPSPIIKPVASPASHSVSLFPVKMTNFRFKEFEFRIKRIFRFINFSRIFFALPQILKNGSLPVPSYNPNYSVQSPYSTINVNSLPIIFIC